MGLDQLELHGGQPPRLAQDLPGDLHLPHVVDQGADAKAFQPPGVQSHNRSDLPGKDGHPLLVFNGVGIFSSDDESHGADHVVESLLKPFIALFHPVVRFPPDHGDRQVVGRRPEDIQLSGRITGGPVRKEQGEESPERGPDENGNPGDSRPRIPVQGTEVGPAGGEVPEEKGIFLRPDRTILHGAGKARSSFSPGNHFGKAVLRHVSEKDGPAGPEASESVARALLRAVPR